MTTSGADNTNSGVGVSLASQGIQAGGENVIQGFPSQAKMEGLFFNGLSIGPNPFSLTQVNDTCNLRLAHPHRRQLYLHVQWTPHLISREAGTKPSLAPDPFPKLLHLALLPCRDSRAAHLRFCDETSCTRTNMLDK